MFLDTTERRVRKFPWATDEGLRHELCHLKISFLIHNSGGFLSQLGVSPNYQFPTGHNRSDFLLQ